MLKGIRIRIYPNRLQKELIEKTFGCTRKVYNQGLNLRISEYKNNNNSIGYKETSAMLTAMKKDTEYTYLKEVDSMALQQALRDLDKSYKNFFKSKMGFPKFKSKRDNHKSYRTQNTNNCIAPSLDGKYIKLPKLGRVKAKISIDVSKAKINNATIERIPSGKYFCVLNVEIPTVLQSNYGGMAGIDLGIKTFYADSNGNFVDNNQYTKRYEKRLRKAQRQLSHMIESHIVNYKIVGNNRYPVYDKPLSECSNIQKQRTKVALIQEKIANSRNDFLQKESTKLIKENQLIGIEDLAVKNMVKNHKLAKSISDVSWSKFVSMLEYKAPIYGTEIIKVPRFYASSQTCNCCGYKNPKVKNLNIRDWTCPNCDAIHNRDTNAAINILNKALEIKSNSELLKVG